MNFRDTFLCVGLVYLYVLEPASVFAQSIDKLSKGSNWLKYMRAGERASELHRLAMAQRFFEAALAELDAKKQSEFRLISNLKSLALIQAQERQYSKAEKNLKIAIAHLEEKPEGPLLASCLYSLADVLSHDPTRSKELTGFLENALRIWRQTLLRRKALILKMLDVGAVFALAGMPVRALEIYELALDYSRELGPQSGSLKASCIAYAGVGASQVGQFYEFNGVPAKAIPAYLSAEKHYLELGPSGQENLILLYSRLSSVYEALEKPSQAIEYQKRLIAVLSKEGKGSTRDIEGAKRRLGELIQKQLVGKH